MTKQFEFSPEDVEEINYQRYHHLAPIVQRRMDAIRLKAYGLLHKQIVEIIGITENTLRDYFELYEQGGLEKLKEIHYYQPESELKEHIVSLEVSPWRHATPTFENIRPPPHLHLAQVQVSNKPNMKLKSLRVFAGARRKFVNS
jgi:hypothetical protein